jgi:meiotic recombination protein SPO11
MQTYRQGSIALAHESSLTVPELKWVGLRLDDVVEGGMADETLMPLTAIDRERIRAMLARQSGETENLQRESFSELQRMLILNIKAEIQLLEDRPGGLVWWLEQRIGKELRFAVRDGVEDMPPSM